MTQTFSEILEEKLNIDESFHPDSTTHFYAGTAEANCLIDLILQGFQPPTGTRIHKYKVSPLLEPDYKLDLTQRQAVEFFNQYLQGSLQLKGPFSLYKLQRVYRLLAKKLHPDLGGSAELFRELHTGYKILLDFMTKIK